ncbi:hypothetical protein KGF54_001666 [Candida jiufengensis]|uniref:uncharacterized protein n=1 Tax=Candida jiufengensis TaxID=497108 RepID=UPI0022247B09|nr:uncharacterized protein KGF54_001666 [Candida jiufengensis]KAI5955105.1 hypothetical protein KGF54_001666 [Candida jiufengensis]
MTSILSNVETTSTDSFQYNDNNNNNTNNNNYQNEERLQPSLNYSAPISPNTSNKINNTQQYDNIEGNIDDYFSLEQTDGKGWLNDYAVPYSLINYSLSTETSTKINFNENERDSQFVFRPNFNLREIEHSAFGRIDLNVSEIIPPIETEELKIKKKQLLSAAEEKIDAFSGYITTPKVSFNIPNSIRNDKRKLKLMSDVPKVCFQNLFAIDEVSYIFGGLFVTKFSTFNHLGITSETHLKKLSIYFPYKVPPFVDSKMLTSPFLQPNPHFITYNAIRGTVTYMDTSNLGDFPGHLLSMISTQISPRHYFFYGGFHIEDISKKYHRNIDKWIIKKKIVMNEDGYILDTITLKFTKIALEKSEKINNVGRIGSGICSNIYDLQNAEKEKIFDQRVSSPSNSEARDQSNNSRDQSNNSPITKQTTNRNKAGRDSPIFSREEDSQSQHIPPQSQQPTDDEKIKPKLHKIVTSQSTGSFPEPKTSSSSSSSKMDKFKNKFHRTNLKNTYSQKVREKRSNSTNNSSGGSSRAVSPVLNAAPAPTQSNYNNSGGASVISQGTTSTTTTAHPTPHSHSQQPSVSTTGSNNNNNLTTPIVPTPTLAAQSPITSPVFSARPITPLLYNQNKFRQDNSGRSSPNKDVIEFVKTDHANESKNHSPHNEDQPLEDSFTTRSKSPNPLFVDSNSLSGVSVFVFGGFVLDEIPDEKGIRHFKANNDLLKIDISTKEEHTIINIISFLSTGIVSRVGSNPETCDIILQEDEYWPSPRGYFAHIMIDYTRGLDEGCLLDVSGLDEQQIPPRAASPDLSISGSSGSFQIGGAPSVIMQEEEPLQIQSFFKKRTMMIQGGCNENNEFFSDFYRFIFETCKWEKVTTYTYDYFNKPIKPGEDEDATEFTMDNVVADPELKEAELRCCHHTCLYYQNEERGYLFFVGGVKQDHLRFLDKTPYVSDKYDVSRFSKLPLITNNTNTMRIAVLNIQTQTWRFMRYYYDVNHAMNDSWVNRMLTNEAAFMNSRISHVAGTTNLTGKTLTLSQGLVIISPAKKEDLKELEKEIPCQEMFWGGQVQLTFAGL